MKIWQSFFVLILIGNLAFGNEDSIYLPKGTVAPYSGILLSVPRAQETRRKVIEGESYQFQTESLQKSLTTQKQLTDLSEQKMQLYANQNDKLAKSLSEARSTSDLTKVFYFVGGAAAVILGGWAIGQIRK